MRYAQVNEREKTAKWNSVGNFSFDNFLRAIKNSSALNLLRHWTVLSRATSRNAICCFQCSEQSAFGVCVLRTHVIQIRSSERLRWTIWVRFWSQFLMKSSRNYQHLIYNIVWCNNGVVECQLQSKQIESNKCCFGVWKKTLCATSGSLFFIKNC